MWAMSEGTMMAWAIGAWLVTMATVLGLWTRYPAPPWDTWAADDDTDTEAQERADRRWAAEVSALEELWDLPAQEHRVGDP